jgi:hypothetical protein
MGVRGKGKERTFLERFFLPLPPAAGGTYFLNMRFMEVMPILRRRNPS